MIVILLTCGNTSSASFTTIDFVLGLLIN